MSLLHFHICSLKVCPLNNLKYRFYGIKCRKMALRDIDFAYEFSHKFVKEYYGRFVEIINQLVLLYVPMHMSTGHFF